MIDILLVDDQELVRAGFRMIIDSTADMRIVGEAADGAEALVLIRALRPAVVMMDIRMPVVDGITATRQICHDPELAETRIMIVTTFDNDAHIFDALQAGASGFIGKDVAPDELLNALRTLGSGSALVLPEATRALIAAANRSSGSVNPVAQRSLSTLTARERHVVELVARGYNNDEIGTELFISPATVKTHVSRSLSKVMARDRAQLVIAAYEGGLLTPGGS